MRHFSLRSYSALLAAGILLLGGCRKSAPMGVYTIATSEGTAEDIYNLNFVEQ